jgi:hypothetical protein
MKTSLRKFLLLFFLIPMFAFQCDREYVDNAFDTYTLKIENIDGTPLENISFRLTNGLHHCYYDEALEETICVDHLDIDSLNFLKNVTTDAHGNLRIVHPRQYHYKYLVLNQNSIFSYEIDGEVVQRNFVVLVRENVPNFIENITLISP